MSTFYKLTKEEVIEMDDLSKSEMRVLLYMRSCAPFPNCKVEFEAKAVAEELGIDRSTVSKAWKKLDQLGYIDMDIKKISASVIPFSLSKGGRRNRPLVGETAEDSAKPPTNRRNGTNRSRKRLSSLNPEPLQINKTNKTNQKRERANEILEIFEADPEFKSFCFRKANELPDRPVLIESWIVSNFKELESMYKTRIAPVNRSSAAAEISKTATETATKTATESPKVAIALAMGEIRQDPLFPDGIFDLDGNWHKKSDWEAMQNDDNN